MDCPKCGGKQYCPCAHCKERHKQETTWIWVTGNGPIKCGWCGYIMSISEWEDLEWQAYKKRQQDNYEGDNKNEL